nr:MAG TPA: Rho termination factor, N-terminal domain [Caudoviricetes sp.]
MKFPYIVIRDGKWYKAGEEVPEGTPGQESSDEEIQMPEVFKYKKTDINRMSTADLKELAREHEVLNVDDMTGQDLKEYFITRFNL